MRYRSFWDMTEEEKTELAKKIAEGLAKIQHEIVKELMDDFMYECNTPFYVKWFKKLKAKFTKN